MSREARGGRREKTRPAAGARAPVVAPRAGGRTRLIAAALKLAARNGGLRAVGMRELAREAGLNPNTFYRHFADFDELGVAAVEDILPALRQGLREIRAGSAGVGEAIVRSVRYFFDFASKNPEAIVVAWGESQGPSPAMREALGAGLGGLIRDLADAMVANQWNHPADAPELADAVVRFLFVLGVDYVRDPGRRADLAARGEHFILSLFAGANVVRALNLDPRSPVLGQLPRLLAAMAPKRP